ncbi:MULTISPECIES: hypothetical protein [Paenibacillus]|uniref:hypothetical protein n=1 Tax=Paenibacillus TaxID=44249 RepID=UPI0012F81B36|nr:MULTISPECIES: hypothetical protein [Paenibacillus]MCM3495351.1 hypothetical protein [Paenibacillus lactis]
MSTLALIAPDIPVEPLVRYPGEQGRASRSIPLPALGQTPDQRHGLVLDQTWGMG